MRLVPTIEAILERHAEEDFRREMDAAANRAWAAAEEAMMRAWAEGPWRYAIRLNASPTDVANPPTR